MQKNGWRLLSATAPTAMPRSLPTRSMTHGEYAALSRVDAEDALVKAIYDAVLATKGNHLSDALLHSSDVPIYMLHSEAARDVCRALIQTFLNEKIEFDNGRVTRRLSEAIKKLTSKDILVLIGEVLEHFSHVDTESAAFRPMKLFNVLVPAVPADQSRAITGALAKEIKRIITTTRSLQIVEQLGEGDIKFRLEDAMALAVVIREEIKGKRSLDDKVAAGFVSIVAQLPVAARLELLVSVLKYPTAYGPAQDKLLEGISALQGDQFDDSGNIWSLIAWVQKQPRIDVFSLPQRRLTSGF
jgi:hypothetical protein